MNLRGAATLCYGASLFTLPWAGMGLLHLSTGRDFGGGLQPAWLLLALACGLRGLDAISSRRQPGPAPWPRVPAAWRRGVAAIAASVALSILGIWLAPSGEPLTATLARYGKQVMQLAIMAVFVMWPALWTRGERRWAWTARWLVAGALFQVGYGLLQQVHYYRPLEFMRELEHVFTSNPAILSGSEELYVGDRFLSVRRLRGTICEPLYLGNYLLFVLPLLPLVRWRAAALRPTAALLGGLLLLTWSRGAWLAAGAAGVLALVLGRGTGGGGVASPRLRRWLAIGLGLFLLAGLVSELWGWHGFWLPWRRLAQSFSTRDWSNLTRWYSLQAAWRAFQLSPLVGIGWGQYGWHFPALVDPVGLQAMFSWPVVGNYPLQILCETGLAGGTVFAVIAWRQVRAYGRARRANRAAGGGFGAPCDLTAVALAGVALQLLTFSQYNLPHIWVAWGLFLASTAPAFAADGGRPGEPA